MNIIEELEILKRLIQNAEEKNQPNYASYLRGRRDALLGIVAYKNNGEKKE